MSVGENIWIPARFVKYNWDLLQLHCKHKSTAAFQLIRNVKATFQS